MSHIARTLAAVALLLSGAARADGKPPRVLTPKQIGLQNLNVDPALPKADGKRAATKLVYIMVDNNLAGIGRSTLEALKDQKKLAPTAHSLVYFDTTSFGPQLWNLGDEPRITSAKSPLGPTYFSRTPSNSVLVMSKVFRWAMQSYPAEHRYLQIYSHGGAARGVGADQDSPYRDGLMPIQGLARALRDSGDGRPYDLVYFTACLMGSIEALYEIAPSVRYAVASELPITGSAGKGTVAVGTPLLFEKLVRDGMEPKAMARTLAQRSVDKEADGVATIVAMDLSRLDALVKQIAQLVRALQALPPAADARVREALLSARVGKDEWGVGDLWRFARALDKAIQDPAVQREVKALYRAQASATLFEKSTAKDGTGGLSVHLPQQHGLFPAYAKSRFARDTGWPELLRRLGLS
jgi:hypothetical protein